MSEESDKIRIHVVYENPLDAPGYTVVRGHHGQSLDALMPEPGAVAFTDLELARVYLRALQLVPFNKDPDSDKSILEVWGPLGMEWPFGRKNEA